MSSSEDEESSDDNWKEPTVDKRQKGSQKASNSVHRSTRNKRDVDDDMNDVNSDDDDGKEKQMTRRSLAKGVRKRIFDDTSSENKEVDKEDNEDYDEGEQEQERTLRRQIEMRKMEIQITELKSKNKT